MNSRAKEQQTKETVIRSITAFPSGVFPCPYRREH
jgi:hypothetical protein